MNNNNKNRINEGQSLKDTEGYEKVILKKRPFLMSFYHGKYKMQKGDNEMNF